MATNSLLLAGVLGTGAAIVVGLLTLVEPAVARGLPPALLLLALAVIPVLVARQYLTSLLEGDYRFDVSNSARLLSPLAGVVVNGALAAAGALTAATASVTWVAYGCSTGARATCGRASPTFRCSSARSARCARAADRAPAARGASRRC